MHGIFTAKYTTTTMLNPDEIIHTVNSIYSKAETTMLTLKDEKNGLIRVNSAAEKWYIVLNGSFCNVSHDLNFTAGRNTPFILSPSGGTFLAINPVPGGKIRKPSLMTACKGVLVLLCP